MHVLSCYETREAVLRPLRYEETVTGFKRACQSLGISRSDDHSAAVVRALDGDNAVCDTHTLLNVHTRFDAFTWLSIARRGQKYLRIDCR